METKRVYEALFLIDSALAASQWDHINEVINKIFARAQARVISVRKWDERKLAYEVDRKARGTYILAYFECSSLMVRQLERDVQLSEDILRVLVIRTDRMKPEEMEKPTPAMIGHAESQAAAGAATDNEAVANEVIADIDSQV